jgi:hypothetical protein
MERLPEVSPEAVRREADFAEAILGRLRAVRAEDLSHEDWLTWKILAWEAQATVEQSGFYWNALALHPYASRGILRDPTPALTSVHGWVPRPSAGDGRRPRRLPRSPAPVPRLHRRSAGPARRPG